MTSAIDKLRSSLAGFNPSKKDVIRGNQNPLREEEEPSDEIMDEDDYVAEVLARQRRLADLVPPEDAFVASLPANVHQRLFTDMPAPKPPPKLKPGEKPPYSSYSTYAFTMGPREQNEGEVSGPELDHQASSSSSSSSALSNFRFLSFEQLLCLPQSGEGGGGGTLSSMPSMPSLPGVAAEAKKKKRKVGDPFEFDPVGGALAVELRGVAGLLKINGECDPWVVCQLVGADGLNKGTPAVWPRKRATTSPVWNVARFVGPPGYVCQPGDRLEFKVFQGGLGSETGRGGGPQLVVGGDLVGVCELGNLDGIVPVPTSAAGATDSDDHDTALPVQRKVRDVMSYRLSEQLGALFSGGGGGGEAKGGEAKGGEAKGGEAKGEDAHDRPCTLSLRVVPPPPAVKRVFFIRHGQSEWNRATEETYRVPDMLAFDHPLSEAGISEACGLKLAIDRAAKPGPQSTAAEILEVNEFLGAPLVVSSPLTRALQTAMVALRDHPAVKQRGVVLRSDARELKNTLGLDTISSTKGEAVATRAKRKCQQSPALFDSVLASGRKAGSAAARAVRSIEVDGRDARGQWWSYLESPEEKAAHVAMLVRLVRMAPHRTLVVVGHSLLFRAMMAAYAGPGVDPRFKDKKLVNCGCMAVDFDFAYAEGSHAARHAARHAASFGAGGTMAAPFCF